MTENPDFWNTIATVIPVLVLTYATAVKRRDWHRLKAATRRWTALYGAALVLSLIWVETVALNHLRLRTTSGTDESSAYLILGWAVAQVLAVPAAPLIVLAIHDLHPKVVQAKRKLKADTRKISAVRKEYTDALAMIETVLNERRLEGAEQVLRTPELVFSPSGRVREDYVDRVPQWRSVGDFKAASSHLLETVERDLGSLEKQVKKSEKQLKKAISAQTKKTAKRTDLHR